VNGKRTVAERPHLHQLQLARGGQPAGVKRRPVARNSWMNQQLVLVNQTESIQFGVELAA
jgi:hypothetical protein